MLEAQLKEPPTSIPCVFTLLYPHIIRELPIVEYQLKFCILVPSHEQTVVIFWNLIPVFEEVYTDRDLPHLWSIV